MAVFEKVKEVLVENLSLNEEDITQEAHIIDDLGADSLDIMETIMALEEEFDVKFPEAEIKEIQTVGDLVRYIEEKIG